MISWLMAVVVSSALILIVLHVLVNSRLKLDCEKPAKEEAGKVFQRLMEEKKSITVCTKDNFPRSIQVEEVITTANTFALKKSLTKISKEEREMLVRWIQVFSNKTSLALSFRETNRGFSSEFLRISPDLDYGALGTLACICNKCEDFNQELNKAIVFIRVTLAEYA